MADDLSRLSFGAMALEETRPFLGPVFAWCSAAPQEAILEIPITIRLVLKYLIILLKKGGFRQGVPANSGYEEREFDECFRADAKAEGGSVALGGWECRGGVPPSKARWFAIEVNKKNFPWVFRKGEPFRAIATLELLATLLCWIAFAEDAKRRYSGVTFSGTTDNKGNSHVTARLMTSKFPWCVVLMELSARMSRQSKALDLRWLPREQNTEADNLSNMSVHQFDPARRIRVDLENMDFILLRELM